MIPARDAERARRRCGDRLRLAEPVRGEPHRVSLMGEEGEQRASLVGDGWDQCRHSDLRVDWCVSGRTLPAKLATC